MKLIIVVSAQDEEKMDGKYSPGWTFEEMVLNEVYNHLETLLNDAEIISVD